MSVGAILRPVPTNGLNWIRATSRGALLSGYLKFRLLTAGGRHQIRRTNVTISYDERRGTNASEDLPPKTRPTRGAVKLPEQGSLVRTRFAPSPTGYLHIGGLRTALFSYLLAKRCAGQFVLRIEDTDQKRLISDAEQRIFQDLQWAGLEWDEGPDIGGTFGPYRQSERTLTYQAHARQLLDKGSAYRCFCTPQTAGAKKSDFVVSGCYQNCADLPSDQSLEQAENGQIPFTVRLRPPPKTYKPVYLDLTYGKVQKLVRGSAASLVADTEDGAGTVGDTILVKSDGTPTYHFANVVDDHLMKISHVIRGDEWLASTPLHYDIYHAFGWTPPQFAHVGLLVDSNGAKLSKRNADLALDVRSMRESHGILPEALVNFLVLLGWSNPQKRDLMNLAEIARNFDLKFTKGNTQVRMEKLWFLQKKHFVDLGERVIETGSLQPIRDVLTKVVAEAHRIFPDFLPPELHRTMMSAQDGALLKQSSFPPSEHQQSLSQRRDDDALTAYCADILLADSKTYTTAQDFISRHEYFFRRPIVSDQADPTANTTEMEPDNKLLKNIATQVLDNIGSSLISAINNEPMQKAIASSSDSTQITPGDLVTWPHVEAEGAKITSALLERRTQVAETIARLQLIANSNPTSNDVTVADPTPNHMQTTIQSERNSSDQPPSSVGDQDATLAELTAQISTKLNSDLMRYLRLKLCGGQPGPHIGLIMAILGPDECRARLRDAAVCA